MFDYQEIFHIGVRVPDVDAEMRAMSETLGVTWARVQHTDVRAVWTPERGAEVVSLTFTYTCEGPQHVELLQGSPGSIWDCGDTPGLHHVGVWSDDIAADAGRFEAAGWQVSAAATPPDEGYGSFAYVRSPAGLIVELVSSAAQPRFDTWFAGGSLGSDRHPVSQLG
jgi:catechol 2,3-dioxygenase-like lactoylglutathione lyase family enzyme